jgi:hypothetical protein
MLSLERCREVLGDDAPQSDAELELLRDQLYGLADVLIDGFVEQRQRRKGAPQNTPEGVCSPVESLSDALHLVPTDDQGDVEERAAIMESDGGLDRDAAERAAFADYWRRKHKPQKS